jgi:hypothetical protein
MENVNTKALNEIFVNRLDTELEKVAQETGQYIRTKLRENAFSRKIINPQYVTKADLQRTTQHDQLVKIVDIEPDAGAMMITLRGEPDAQYVEGNRAEISFFGISSKEFQKTEEELLAYEMPITELVERNAVKEIMKIEDTAFMTAVNAALTISSKTVNYTSTVSGTMELAMFIKLFNKLEEANVTVDANPLVVDVVLLNQADYNKLVTLPATTIGSGAASEQYINGFKYATLLGKKFVTTIKGDLVPEGSIYAFASQEFLGKFYVLNDVKFWIEKKRNLIKWSAYETLGLGIINTKSIAKLTWTNAVSA